jgi:tRNA pseudouridine32 synthase/23S rRNA pseudouridine746 synthase
MRHPTDDITVIARADGWLAINKPHGVLSVPGKGPANARSCASWVRDHFPDATGPITVHRLDMDTSGVLLVALNPVAHRELSMQFERRETEKEYLAVVHGHIPTERGQISLPIRPDISRRPYQIVDHVHGSPSQTVYQVLAYEPDRTRLALTPITGRTHQLRVHCAAIGHAIVGDVLYGPEAEAISEADARGDIDTSHEIPRAERLLLHASRLVFTDPVTGRRVEVRSPAPF